MTLARAGQASSEAAGRVRTEAGETLIELLVAIVLMGIAFTSILGALYTSARVAQINQRNSKASIALQGLAEVLLQPSRGTLASTYIPCATGSVAGPVDSYKAALPDLDAVPPGWDWNVVKVRYGADPEAIPANADVYKAAFTRTKAECDSGGPTGGDKGLQELTIEVTNAGTSDKEKITRQLVVVKRDRSCPTNFSNADKGPC